MSGTEMPRSTDCGRGPTGRFADAGRDILLIGAAWSILIATMLALQMFGFNFGFDVWPTGEFAIGLTSFRVSQGSVLPRRFGRSTTAMCCRLGGTSRRHYQAWQGTGNDRNSVKAQGTNQ